MTDHDDGNALQEGRKSHSDDREGKYGEKGMRSGNTPAAPAPPPKPDDAASSVRKPNDS